MPPGNDAAPSSSEPAWYEPILQFAGHIMGGTAIFLLIAGAAWFLREVTAYFDRSSLVLRYGLMIVEYAVFTADALLFLLFVARTFWRAARKLMGGWST
jgi:hypothetical protein